jgi:hypothetical protein
MTAQEVYDRLSPEERRDAFAILNQLYMSCAITPIPPFVVEDHPKRPKRKK